MRAYVRSSLLAVAASQLVLGSFANANPGVYLPPAPQGPGGEDSVDSSSGTRCRQSMNSNNGYVDLGITGSAGSPVRPNNGGFINITDRDREAVAYARVTVPLGQKPKRLDCSRLYELELERLRQEIEILKMNAE